jgi:hypothetical protein
MYSTGAIYMKGIASLCLLLSYAAISDNVARF